MGPGEDQIKELMTTVACSVCGATYQQGGVEVLGHRDALWFLRVSCGNCSTSGLVAAMVKTSDGATAEPRTEAKPDAAEVSLDRARAPGPITQDEVVGMRDFLEGFDGDFQALFASEPDPRSHRPAA
jgi:ribosomal protein S27E